MTAAATARLGSPGVVSTARTLHYGAMTVQELASGYIGPPAATLSFTYWDGTTEHPATVTVWDGSTEHTPTGTSLV